MGQIELLGNPNPIEEKPWTDDEIAIRIRMLENMRRRVHDDISRIQLSREIATWRELMKRRETLR